MILVGLHTLYVPVILLAGLKQILLYVIPELYQEQLLPILRDQDQMHHKKVLVVPSVLVSFVEIH